jgi:hypothetical protein
MIGLTSKVEDRFQRVKAAADRSNFKNLGHAAATIRKQAAASIEVSPDASPAGTPPHTRRRQLKRAIKYDVDKAASIAVIGAEFSKVGTSASAHELGGEYKGQEYPKRGFMLPALEANEDRIAGEWKGSIGE